MRRLAHPGITLAALLVLLALSALLRTRALDASLWIDEGISAGIASHPAGEIPGLLRQDGSPPGYYILLHAWTELAGTSEAALRAPSLAFALLAIPAALWAGWSLFGRKAGWLCAVVAAVFPFLTAQAQEARMYTLVALLSIAATATFLHAFVFRRGWAVPVFAVLLGLLLYTHYWALFLALGWLGALAVVLASTPPPARRRLATEAGFAFGFAGLAFAPWVPTLAFQLEHTGAPWSSPPPVAGLVTAFAVGVAGFAISRLGADARERLALQALTIVGGLTLAAGWTAAVVEPAWAGRYLAVLVGPLLLLVCAALARVGPLGVVAVAAASCAWLLGGGPAEKSNVERATAALSPGLVPGDLVVSTQPEQVPVLSHYLPDGLRYATPLGPVADPGVMDWRNALTRLESTDPENALVPLLDSLPNGARILLVAPDVDDDGRWRAPWTRLVAERSREWALVLGADERFRRVRAAVPTTRTAKPSVRLTLFAKTLPTARGR